MNLIKKGAIALSLILVSGFVYSQTYKPVIKVAKGQEFTYSMDMNMEMTQSMGGQEMKYGTTGTSTIKNSVAEVQPNGNFDVNTSVWDAKVNTKIMGKDSTMTYAGQAGSSTKFTLDKLGNIVSKIKTEGEKIENKIPGMDNMMNSPAFCEFPENTLKPGDKWTKSHNDTVAAGPIGKLEFNIKTNYTYVGKETVGGKSLNKMTTAAEIKISGKGNMQGMDIAIDGTGVVTGVIYLDAATGIVQTNKSDTELDMNVAVSGQQNMTIPMTQKMTMNYKLIK